MWLLHAIQLIIIIIIIIIYPLAARVVEAPQLILQPASSIGQCSPLSLGPSKLHAIHSLVLFSHLFCLSYRLIPVSVSCKTVWSYLVNRRHNHTTAIWIFSQCSGGLHSHGPTACWVLSQSSTLATWLLYDKRRITQHVYSYTAYQYS